MLKILEIATAEVGYLEKASNSQLDGPMDNAGSGNWTKYARDLDGIPGWYNGPKNGYEWCAVFFDWCLIQAYGVDKARMMTNHTTAGAGCTWAAQAYLSADQWSKTPKVGDQVFFGSGINSCTHTGIVYNIDNDRIYTIEGNTSGNAGLVSNGGGVFRKSYAKNYTKIVGYGRPKYEIAEDDNMTGEEIYKALTEYLRTLKCPENMQAELNEAIELGITDGTRPMDVCRRCEAAIMVKRSVKK